MILGDAVGLGKTRTVIRALQLRGVAHAAVVCPAVVVDHWRREAAAVYPGLKLTVVSYGKLSRQSDVQLGPMLDRPTALVVDEFHYCKSIDSKRTKLVFGPGGLSDQMLEAGGAVWAVSGTPMPRNPYELFPAFWALWRGDLFALGIKGHKDWLNTFCVWAPTDYGIRVYAPKNVPVLKSLFPGRLLRRRHVELPPVRTGVLTLTAADLGTLPDLDPETAARLASGQLPPMSPNLARYRHAVGDLKAPLVAEIVAEELDDEKASRVVLAYHHSVLDALEDALWEFHPVRVDGSTSAAQRQTRVADFCNKRPLVRVFLGQIGACGTGMDGLQHGAHEMLIAEPDWDSALNVQAVGRLHRMGQMKPVNVRFVALADTLDEAIVRQHERETAMRAVVVE